MGRHDPNRQTHFTLPIFPLEGAVLLPSGDLPLNIFEPRYIAMVQHVMKRDRLIGMIEEGTLPQMSTRCLKLSVLLSSRLYWPYLCF